MYTHGHKFIHFWKLPHLHYPTGPARSGTDHLWGAEHDRADCVPHHDTHAEPFAVWTGSGEEFFFCEYI